MPAWLLILILMELVIVVINPDPKDYLWYRGLRRPHWLRFFIWIPLIWLVISAGLYFSALLSWESSNSLLLLLSYLLLLAVLESHTWLLCSYRNLRLGAGVLLVGWIYALVLAISLLLRDSTGMASQLLLPLLIWAPIEAYALERMRLINR
ncbi:MAG: tryptophan-rich sensory protein [Synechococcaceae cyanobacterium]|nr:tryptophan-rich sensory protein [Synechococcaceae cyanobacterium]